MKQRKGIRAVFAFAVAGLLAVSGCSSSDNEPDSSGDRSSATAPAGSSDVKAKILVIGDFTSTIPFTLPEIVPMVKGVLKNFPNVEVGTCDAKGSASSFLACEQQAVQDNVAAVVLGFSAGGQDLSVLTKSSIPVIGTTDSRSLNFYPTAEAFSSYVALGAGLAETGCKKLGIVHLDGSDFLVDYIKAGFEGKGGKEVARGAVANNAADLSPAVSKVTGAGAECVAVSLTPAGAAQALTALKQSGKTVTIGGISAVFSTELLKSLGALADGLIVVDTVLNPSDDAAGIKEAAAAMREVDSKAKMTQQAVGAFIAAKLIAAGLPTVSGEVTAASLTTALDGLRNVDMNGVIPPWSSVPVEGKTFPRIFNHYGINYKIQDGKAVKQGDFYDILALLTGK